MGYNNNQNNVRNNNHHQSYNEPYQPTVPYKELDESSYVEIAEKVINTLNNNAIANKKKVLTTSKIRNILALNAEIYNDVINDASSELPSDIVGRINYLKVRVLYESGRESSVKDFVTEASLLKHIENIKNNKSKYLLFSRYLEALVAYRKFIVGKDE